MKRSFWGWGNADFKLDPNHFNKYYSMLQGALSLDNVAPMRAPSVDEIDLPNVRIDLPDSLMLFSTDDKYERAAHTYGKAFRDVWRGLNNDWAAAPDLVAFPRIERELTELMRYCSENNIAVIPYGGGSSVCGGVESRKALGHAGVVSVDMKHFDQVLKIDKDSRSALIQGGTLGPDVERQLKPHGLTLRHYPQSFEFSTVGGWVATRSGGHFATLYTHIDEFVQSIRMITPSGIIQTKKLPGHGAGPSEERFYCGTEGAVGIITEVWLRLQEIPKFKATKTVQFSKFSNGVEACRQIAQSGLNPANARLVDHMEAVSNGLGDGQSTVLIIGFESHNFGVASQMESAIGIAEKCGGIVNKTNESKTKKLAPSDNWKNSFLVAPYLRDEMVRHGLVVETFETATTWDQFADFHKSIMQTAKEAIAEYCGQGIVTVRFTHLYPDGPAPYYTVMAKGKAGEQLEQWDKIKHSVSKKIVEMGGPITHHHAVGKDHQQYYEVQRSKLFGDVLKKAKEALDPNGIMNPGTLI